MVLTLAMGVVSAWLVTSGSSSHNFKVGKISISLTSDKEEEVPILLTSPSFLLDPDIIPIYEDSDNDKVIAHKNQFNESVVDIEVVLKNDGNIKGKIGYGNGVEAAGIETMLIGEEEDLSGLIFAIIPETNIDDFYTYLLDSLQANNQSLEYTNFNDLKAKIETINNATIENIKEEILEPEETIIFNILVWQEYYDKGYYQSQYEDLKKIISQEFVLKLKVYFGQMGIE